MALMLFPLPQFSSCTQIPQLVATRSGRTPTDMAMFSTLPELVGPSVIIETVKWHFEDFVGLPQAIPGSVIPFIHLYGMSVKEKETN